MPGRKSNVSTTSNGPEEAIEQTSATKANKERDGLSVEDLSLPKSMIARLSKGVLPANTQIHKDALLALHKSATVFVSYIASNANDNATGSGKKTISPQDVMAALKDSELEGFLPRLEAELKKYNDIQCDKRNNYRKKVKEEKAAATVPDAPGEGEDGESAPKEAGTVEATNGTSNGHADSEDAERPMKKLKSENGHALAPEVDVDAEDADDDQEADEQDDEADEEVVEDEIDDEEDDDVQDETMEDALEEPEGRSELRDEALDEPDSD